jgi:ABC-2 type transport system permease protein
MIGLMGAEVRYQLKTLWRTPDRMLPLAMVPLFTAAFLTIMTNSGRRDLAASAVIGASIIGIWSSAVYIAGDVIEDERWLGTLEDIVASPAPLSAVVLGRIGTVTAVSFIGLLESTLVAKYCYGLQIHVYHKVLFAATLLCAWAAMAGTALIMSGLFVLTRSIRTFQNSLTYPFYLLSGAVAPVSLLPGWLRPFSKAVFLSWAADLLRVCMRPGPAHGVVPRLCVILALGGVGLGFGLWSITLILRRIRHLGTIGLV